MYSISIMKCIELIIIMFKCISNIIYKYAGRFSVSVSTSIYTLPYLAAPGPHITGLLQFPESQPHPLVGTTGEEVL